MQCQCYKNRNAVAVSDDKITKPNAHMLNAQDV